MEDTVSLWASTFSSVEEIFRATSGSEYSVWKVLILDEYSSLVLSSFLSLGKLREYNVTMHLGLEQDRERVLDGTAVYLIQPLLRNIELILRDFRKGQYQVAQVHFLSEPTDEVLGRLKGGTNLPCVLESVYMHDLNYIVLEEQLVTLNLEFPLFDPNEETVRSAVSGVFSLLQTCKMRPVIRTGKGLSKAVGSALTTKCWETPPSTTPTRPLLLILDRAVDLSIMLHHAWTYQALVYDLLSSSLNKVLLPGANPTVHELNSFHDTFWRMNSSSEFGEVLRAVDREFCRWKSEYESMGKDLLSAFDRVSEMSQEKSQLDAHMEIASFIVAQAKGRHLDLFTQAEERLLQGKSADILELLNSPLGDEMQQEDWETDKLRIQVIGFLHRQLARLPDAKLEKFLDGLRREQATNSALKSISGFAGKVKNKLMGREEMCAVTRTLHSVLSGKDSELDLFDTGKTARQVGEFSDIVVLVLGGGCYAEYHNLLCYGEKNRRNILYVATDLRTPKEFLGILQDLSVSFH